MAQGCMRLWMIFYETLRASGTSAFIGIRILISAILRLVVHRRRGHEGNSPFGQYLND